MEHKLRKIADFYGYDSQSRKCIEEMAELTQAINKFWFNDLDNGEKSVYEIHSENISIQNIKEEIADVQIMLWQLCYLLDLDIETVIDYKLNRQIERISKNANS